MQLIRSLSRCCSQVKLSPRELSDRMTPQMSAPVASLCLFKHAVKLLSTSRTERLKCKFCTLIAIIIYQPCPHVLVSAIDRLSVWYVCSPLSLCVLIMRHLIRYTRTWPWQQVHQRDREIVTDWPKQEPRYVTEWSADRGIVMAQWATWKHIKNEFRPIWWNQVPAQATAALSAQKTPDNGNQLITGRDQ